MFIQFSLAFLFLFQHLVRSTRSDELNSSTYFSSASQWTEKNSKDEVGPMVKLPHLSSSDSLDSLESLDPSDPSDREPSSRNIFPTSKASSSRTLTDTNQFRSGRRIPYSQSFSNEEELFAAIQNHHLSTSQLGHEVNDISKWKEFSSTNLDLQRDLDLAMKRLEISSSLSSHSITLQSMVMKEKMDQLKADRSLLKFTQSLLYLVNNLQELNVPFQLDQVVTLSQWEGDRQSNLEKIQDESILLLDPSKKSYPPISWKRDVDFRHNLEDHETCLSSLKKMYSFDLVNMDKCVGCELNFE